MSAQHTLDEARLIAAAPELLAALQAIVGQDGIKEDTFYRLNDKGEFVEA